MALHNNNNFSRKDVFDILKHMDSFLIKPLLKTFSCFAEYQFKNNSSVFNEFCTLLLMCNNCFESFNTDYLLNKWLKNEGYVETINEFVINSQVVPTYSKGKLVNDQKNAKGIVMPIQFQMKKFFEQNDLLVNTLKFIKSLEESSKIENFVQGKLWKKKKEFYPNRHLIPYFLYLDDIEINNPLGSHAKVHSVCNVYYSFACLPEQESKLRNIFLAAVLKSTDIKEFGNDACFKTLVKELTTIEKSGLDIQINGAGTLIKKCILYSVWLLAII